MSYIEKNCLEFSREIFHSVVNNRQITKIIGKSQSSDDPNRVPRRAEIVVSRIRNKMEIGKTSNEWFV